MARPLTKHDGTGKPYARPPEIEAQIDAALAQDLVTLRRRICATGPASPDYLNSECLVHLVPVQARLRLGGYARRSSPM
jgi:hypothetical protein